MAEKRFKKVFSLHSLAGYDPFNGFGVRGVPRLMLSRSEVIAPDGQLLSRPGRGQLVLRERKPG
jgi:dihydroorotase-like cyclic amidohydrolase